MTEQYQAESPAAILAQRQQLAQAIDHTLQEEAQPFAIVNARKIDANGVTDHAWLVSDGTSITAVGTLNEQASAETTVERMIAADHELAVAIATAHVQPDQIIDAQMRIMTPGYIDIHAHGSWGNSFDDGDQGIVMARAGHMVHGTTRQVLSLITNPLDVMCRNLQTVHSVMQRRADVLGSHLEGPFLALSRKGAHDPNCLIDSTPEAVQKLLDAAQGSLRQITIAPELPHGLLAIYQLANAGVVPAVGHCDADYATAVRAFDAGARIMTHMFDAMNGIHHREPGPIPAAVEDERVSIELINDGFHVQNPVIRMGWNFAPHRIVFVTDAMAATDCPDGQYKLGELDVNVVDGHARLVSNGAIAGSTLLLEHAVQRAVLELGFNAAHAVEAATLAPARALGLDKPNSITKQPLGLLRPSYAADVLLLNAATWQVEQVWCAGHSIPRA
ncbi:N-acetylglucosamine-6-phosphate deacetylase [Bifidobacterium dolichotidis]|uniref:N-acetylglucosamine-6-phosphate deacetylase n=1 Tax=Bifidobacterium dolichotidis TaxID=2306976 RepID=A0A430FPM7_9BIFI|nr:N-acetylglucosamine-6-phosphate deacetylase [Bifidobacterium dolichotidis]RSX54783.1 N-acetylglucosamine-6-phosphate deacetylase [Bifidobacterium dolichotidis]